MSELKAGVLIGLTITYGDWDYPARANDEKLAGAGLDVFEKEPPYGSPLLTLPNVIASTHVVALAKDSMRRVSVWVAEGIVRVLKHERPRVHINPQVLDKQN